MVGDRHSKTRFDDVFAGGWAVVERTWDDRPVTKAEKRAAAVDPDFRPAGDRERIVAHVQTEAAADALLSHYSGHAREVDGFEAGVWY